MNKRNLVTLLSSLGLVGALVSCGPTGGDTSSSSSSTSSWQPGPNAIEGAVQPTNTSPSGMFAEIGNLRKSQNEHPLVSSGNPNIMVVPIQFKDESDMTENLARICDQAFFGEPSTSFISVNEFYLNSSYGTLNIQGVTTPIITLEDDIITTLQKVYSQGASNVVSSIADYVYNYLFNETETYNKAHFDADNDGRIDSLFLLYGFEEGSLQFADSTYQTLSNTLFSENITIKGDGDIANVSWMSGYAPLSSPRFVAEVGDILGLENYLDVTGDVNGNYRNPLGLTDMMDYQLLDHNPFSKWLLGWINPGIVTYDDLSSEMTVRLGKAGSTGDALILAPSERSIYGEYLIIDYFANGDGNFAYTPNRLENDGIRVYKVDSRLVRSNQNQTSYLPYNGTPDFEDGRVYDFAYTNNGINDYASYGIDNNFPLVGLLMEDGSNRHFTSQTNFFYGRHLWVEGDTFIGDSGIDGFYENFRFDGDGSNGAYLNMDFEVNSLGEDASITIRRAN